MSFDICAYIYNKVYMHKVYLSLGTNLGNRKRNIREAIEKIGELIGVVERQSALYET